MGNVRILNRKASLVGCGEAPSPTRPPSMKTLLSLVMQAACCSRADGTGPLMRGLDQINLPTTTHMRVNGQHRGGREGGRDVTVGRVEDVDALVRDGRAVHITQHRTATKAKDPPGRVAHKHRVGTCRRPRRAQGRHRVPPPRVGCFI